MGRRGAPGSGTASRARIRRLRAKWCRERGSLCRESPYRRVFGLKLASLVELVQRRVTLTVLHQCDAEVVRRKPPNASELCSALSTAIASAVGPAPGRCWPAGIRYRHEWRPAPCHRCDPAHAWHPPSDLSGNGYERAGMRRRCAPVRRRRLRRTAVIARPAR